MVCVFIRVGTECFRTKCVQVQIFVSSPTNTGFTRNEDGETDYDHSTPVMPTTSLAPPTDASRPLSAAGSMLSEDGGETVFFTPSPGRLSLFPVDFEVTPEVTHNVRLNEEGQGAPVVTPSDATPAP